MTELHKACFNHALRGSPQLRQKYALAFNLTETMGRGRRGKPGKHGMPKVNECFLDDAEIVRFLLVLRLGILATRVQRCCSDPKGIGCGVILREDGPNRGAETGAGADRAGRRIEPRVAA
jgi:hypothetical protein